MSANVPCILVGEKRICVFLQGKQLISIKEKMLRKNQL